MFKIHICVIPALAALLILSGCGGGGDGSHTVDIVRTPAQLRWADADVYCRGTKFLDQGGWRLPTIEELSAYAKTGNDIADGKGGGAVWSSTEAAPTSHYWVSLNSKNGTAYVGVDTNYYYVRCAHS